MGRKRRSEPTLAERAKFFIARSGKTKEEIADEIGVVPTAVTNWAHGHGVPAFTNLVKFVDALGVDMQTFFGPIPEQPEARG